MDCVIYSSQSGRSGFRARCNIDQMIKVILSCLQHTRNVYTAVRVLLPIISYRSTRGARNVYKLVLIFFQWCTFDYTLNILMFTSNKKKFRHFLKASLITCDVHNITSDGFYFRASRKVGLVSELCAVYMLLNCSILKQNCLFL
jgi:hypothetical protein